eukprot:3031127-Prymnesium_polylepis.1
MEDDGVGATVEYASNARSLARLGAFLHKLEAVLVLTSAPAKISVGAQSRLTKGCVCTFCVRGIGSWDGRGAQSSAGRWGVDRMG